MFSANAVMLSDNSIPFTMTFPSDYAVFSKAVTFNAAGLDNAGVDEIMKMIASSDYLCVAITNDYKNEINIDFVHAKGTPSFLLLEDTDVLSFGEELMEGMMASEDLPDGLIVNPIYLHKNKNGKYIVMQSKYQDVYATQFFTSHNENIYRIAFHNYEARDNSRTSKSIVDTLVFHDEAKNPSAFSRLSVSSLAEGFLTGIAKYVVLSLVLGFFGLLFRKRKTDA